MHEHQGVAVDRPGASKAAAACCLALALATSAPSPAGAQRVHQQAGPAAPVGLPTGPMHVDAWASLGVAAELPSGHMDIKPQDHVEEITVYAQRDRRNTQWRAELHDDPSYEPGGSDAAQRLYAPGPVWSSPEQEHLASSAKDAVGACGALFGLITCPKK